MAKKQKGGQAGSVMTTKLENGENSRDGKWGRWEVINAEGKKIMDVLSSHGGEAVQLVVHANDHESENWPPLIVNGSDSYGCAIQATSGSIRASGVTLTSDGRIKQDIADLDPEQALDNILRLRATEYSHIPEHPGARDRRHRGLVAQEVERVLPHAVHSTGHHKLTDGRRLQNLRAVNYNDVLIELVAAVQALHRRIEHLDPASREPAAAPAARRRARKKTAKRAARKKAPKR